MTQFLDSLLIDRLFLLNNFVTVFQHLKNKIQIIQFRYKVTFLYCLNILSAFKFKINKLKVQFIHFQMLSTSIKLKFNRFLTLTSLTFFFYRFLSHLTPITLSSLRKNPANNHKKSHCNWLQKFIDF